MPFRLAQHRMLLPTLSLLAAASLTACGGGGSDSPPAADQTPTAPSLTVTGTAATGQALALRPVSLRCAVGTGSGTTAADGSFTITVTGGTLPCLLQVTTSEGGALHSVVDGSGAVTASSTVTANITPVTELVVAQALGGSAATAFSNLDNTAQLRLASAQVQAATTAVAAALQGTINLGTGNPMKDTLVAATATSAGNSLDQQLDALQQALAAAQTTVAELTQVLLANAGTPASVQAALQPAVAGCTVWRSGTYWVITPNSTEKLTHVVVDAAAGTVTPQSGQALQIQHDGGCVFSGTFTPSGDTVRMLVGLGGIGVVHYTYATGSSAGKADYSLVVPKQNVPASELTGEWNYVALQRIGALTRSFVGQMEVNGTSQVTSFIECQVQSAISETCNEAATFPALTAHADGGYETTWQNEEPDRLIAHKAPTGEVTLIEVSMNNHALTLFTKEQPLAMPAVGASMAAREFSVGADGFASAIAENDWSVLSTSPNGVGGTFTRGRPVDTRVDTFTINQPRFGFRVRDNGGCTVGGVGNGCAGVVTLPLPGTGMSVFTGVAPFNYAGIAVFKR